MLVIIGVLLFVALAAIACVLYGPMQDGMAEVMRDESNYIDEEL